MSLKHLTIGALVAVCTFVAQAAAQKNELSGILGRTFISDQGIPGAPSYDPNLHFGNGLTFEVNYARRVMDAGLFLSRWKSRSWWTPSRLCTPHRT